MGLDPVPTRPNWHVPHPSPPPFQSLLTLVIVIENKGKCEWRRGCLPHPAALRWSNESDDDVEDCWDGQQWLGEEDRVCKQFPGILPVERRIVSTSMRKKEEGKAATTEPRVTISVEQTRVVEDKEDSGLELTNITTEGLSILSELLDIDDAGRRRRRLVEVAPRRGRGSPTLH